MSVVIGVAASHSTLMNTHWDEVVEKDRAERFKAALGEARGAIAAARPDVAVVIGSNHFRGFWLDLMPSFTLGVGEVIAAGEAGTPEGPQPVDPEFARELLASLVADEFDLTFSARLQIDHGITHAIQYVLANVDVPIVPLVVNVFAPPLPSLRRCLALGDALNRAFAASDKRIAVIASGGLSHQLPWPKWWAPTTDDERFMTEVWLEGRGDRWKEYEVRRRQIVTGSPAFVNEEWDAEVLALIERGDAPELLAYEARLSEVAGNGGNELRTWMIAAAACGHARGRVLAYEPILEWRTGMGVALLTPEAVSR